MSTNCLVKMLKSSVSTDLPVYGEMSFIVPANTEFVGIELGCLGGGNVLKCTGDVEIWNYNHTIKKGDAENPITISNTIPESYLLTVKSSTVGGRLTITNKYNMKETGICDGWFRFTPTYFDTLQGYNHWFKGFCNTLLINENTAKGTYTELVELISGVSEILIKANTSLTGNIKAFLPYKSTITRIAISGPNNILEASMEDLGEFTSLTGLIDFRTINCNIEDFVRALIANGKESGSINATFAPGHKFNGVNVEQSESALTWTATTATYKGVTVNL